MSMELDLMQELTDKVEKNELRARDAEARLALVSAEIQIIHKRRELLELRNSSTDLEA